MARRARVNLTFILGAIAIIFLITLTYPSLRTSSQPTLGSLLRPPTESHSLPATDPFQHLQPSPSPTRVPIDGSTVSETDSSEPSLDENKDAASLEGSVESWRETLNTLIHPEQTNSTILQCPRPKSNRYEYLEAKSQTFSKPRYFLALDLHQVRSLLPRLIGTIIETVEFLGPQNCVLSILEGRSTDGTSETLKALERYLKETEVTFHLNQSAVDPWRADSRIEVLAKLRNQVLLPLTTDPALFADDTTVIFLNDVALCMEDILELIHQRIFQKADVTCAMDWNYPGPDAIFYDVWVSRSINGDQFFQIPHNGSWDRSWDLFWNDTMSRKRWIERKPFQVFSCWNGAIVFSGKPLLREGVHFRSHYDGECDSGEPTLFCKDLWYHGYNRIAVIPTVNVAYSDKEGWKIKELAGYVSHTIVNEGDDTHIQWQVEPPPLVKCVPAPHEYDRQDFVPWDEGLPPRS